MTAGEAAVRQGSAAPAPPRPPNRYAVAGWLYSQSARATTVGAGSGRLSGVHRFSKAPVGAPSLTARLPCHHHQPVLARVSLVLLSVLVLAWSAVLLRDQERGRAAAERLLEDPKSPPEEFGRDMERLEAVELLNPDSQWKLYRSYFWLLRARPGRAAQLAEGLVRDEPENIRAWQQLYLSSAPDLARGSIPWDARIPASPMRPMR